MSKCDKTHHLWITSNDHFTTKFICFQTKSFLNVTPQLSFILKTMCFFVSSEFSGSHRRLRMPSYTFMDFHHWTHTYNKKYKGFHPRGYLFLLTITRHIFSFSCIQPCNPVERYPTVPSPPNQTPNTVLIITMHSHPCHAMFPCINAMRWAIACYIIPHA